MIIGDLTSRAASRTALAVDEEVTFCRGFETKHPKQTQRTHDGLECEESIEQSAAVARKISQNILGWQTVTRLITDCAVSETSYLVRFGILKKLSCLVTGQNASLVDSMSDT
jgi:hypothetical protein